MRPGGASAASKSKIWSNGRMVNCEWMPAMQVGDLVGLCWGWEDGGTTGCVVRWFAMAREKRREHATHERSRPSANPNSPFTCTSSSSFSFPSTLFGKVPAQCENILALFLLFPNATAFRFRSPPGTTISANLVMSRMTGRIWTRKIRASVK